MATITLPLESIGVMRKDGTVVWQHTKMITGSMGKDAAEGFIELMGGNPDDISSFFDKKEAV